MNTKQKVGTGLAILVASSVSLGDAKDAKAQYPQAGCAPRQFTVMQERTITYPVTSWQQETTMVPRTQWVPQTRMVPYTRCETQTIQEPITYQRVDPCRPRCDIGRGVGQFLEGAISLPFEIIGGVLDCRPRPVCAPRVPYCAPRTFAPAVPYNGCGPCGHR